MSDKVRTKEYEVVTCECGKDVPVEFSHIDDEGCWICPECYLDMIEENDKQANEKHDKCTIPAV